MDAQAILWTDTGVYQRRYEKTATALIAVQRALRERHPLGGEEEEFLFLYDAVAAAAPETFTTIWQDPFAYFWSRLAYELTGWCMNPEPVPAALARYCAAIGVEEPKRALAIHLEEFKRFVIALEMISGGTRNFAQALRARLPFAIPGTEFSVLGAGTIDIIGVGRGGLNAIWNGVVVKLAAGSDVNDPVMPHLVARPIVRHGEFEVVLKPETFREPGLEVAQGFSEQPDDYQQQQVPLLGEALTLVERHHPRAFAHLCDMVQVIAFKSPLVSGYSNVSLSDLPGAFIISALPQPYWIADALVHELLHNRLFFVVEREEILEGVREAPENTTYYSPWRDDLRPLSGLLHAVYVFVGVAEFWSSVCASGETSGVLKAYAEDQAVRAVLDLRIGIAQLRRHARFTAAGVGLFRELEREVEELGASTRKLNLSPNAPAMMARGSGEIVPFALGEDGAPISIAGSIEQHVQKFDVHHQCADLREILQLDRL